MRELKVSKRYIPDRVGFGGKGTAVKQSVAFALAFALALPLAMLLLVVAPAANAKYMVASQRLPDLRMASLRDMKIRKTSDGRRLLRFEAIIVNVGAGPFEVHGSRPHTKTPTMGVSQRIYDEAGSYRNFPTTATMFFSGDGHDHWHVKDLQSFTLGRLDGQGAGSVRKGAKQGFCFFDSYMWNGTLPGAPEKRKYKEERMCGEEEEREALKVKMGLSVGWADVYPAYLPLQYVDITGLPSGRYRLKAVADARNQFKESRQGNNYTWSNIELKGNKVRVLKEGPSPRYCGSGRWC